MCNALSIHNSLGNNVFCDNADKHEITTALQLFIIPLCTILFQHKIGSLFIRTIHQPTTHYMGSVIWHETTFQ